MKKEERFIRFIDKTIYVFVIIFLLSLTNSIFVNQIGYYGALLLLLLKFAVTRKNPFHKTGFEILFLLFLLAEFVSANLSHNQPNAFHNLFKRILLIPVVYVMVSSAASLQDAKTFVKVYLGAAVLTVLFYIAFAYEHFISQLYMIESKGPSPFQYVMTAGGLMSFSLIYWFAFLINEKTVLKYKLVYAAGFLITFAALMASYTRASWLGAAAGMFIILSFSRKWLILALFILIPIIFLLVKPNKSNIYIYKVIDDEISEVFSTSTGGRASSIYVDYDTLYLADHENGVVNYVNNKINNRIEFPSPVRSFEKWKDNFYFASTIDGRFYSLQRTNGFNFIFLDEFTSPGLMYAKRAANGYIYILDVDSGLTVYTDPFNVDTYRRYPGINRSERLAINEKYLSLFTLDNSLFVYSLENFFPAEKIYEEEIITNFGFIALSKNNLFFAEEKKLRHYEIDSNGVNLIHVSDEISGTSNIIATDNEIFLTDFDGSVSKITIPIETSIEAIHLTKLPFIPGTTGYKKGKLYFTELYRNRLSTMIDPYHLTNLQRFQQWKVGWKIFKDYPFFGIGDIDLHKVYAGYMEYYEKETFGHLHNIYVHLLATIGLFGFIIVMIIFIKMYITNIKIYNSVIGTPFVSSFNLGTIGVLTTFLVSGLAEFNFGDHEIITNIWFAFGLNLAFFRLVKNQHKN